MVNSALKTAVERLLPRVQTPAQYLRRRAEQRRQGPSPGARQALPGLPRHLHARHEPSRLAGALHDHEQRSAVGLRARLHAVARLRGASCASDGCRSTAWKRSRRSREFDLVGFSLQYEVCYTNILTMLDLGGIPLHSKDRTLDHPLVIAGGPGAQNPELLAPFIDLFVIGDGEESLPWLMERWMTPQGAAAAKSRAGHDRRARRQHDLGLRADVLRAGVPRRRHARRHAPHAQRRAARDPGLHHQAGLRRHPAADAARRAVRADAARPHRHRDHARLSLAVPLLPVHRHQAAACGCARSKPSCRRPWRATATPATTRSACSACSTSDYPYFEELVHADARGVHAAGREHLAAEPAHQPPAPLAAEADAGACASAA